MRPAHRPKRCGVSWRVLLVLELLPQHGQEHGHGDLLLIWHLGCQALVAVGGGIEGAILAEHLCGAGRQACRQTDRQLRVKQGFHRYGQHLGQPQHPGGSGTDNPSSDRTGPKSGTKHTFLDNSNIT